MEGESLFEKGIETSPWFSDRKQAIERASERASGKDRRKELLRKWLAVLLCVISYLDNKTLACMLRILRVFETD